MITFRQFLMNEDVVTSWEKQEVEIEHAYKMIMSECKDAFDTLCDTGVGLYRGDKVRQEDVAVIDTSKAERTSKDTNNLYQLMMDTSPEMKKVPSRTKSLICSTSLDTAKHYGIPYVVLPFDGTTLAYVPKTIDFIRAYVKSPLVSAEIDDIGFYVARFLREADIRRGADGGKQYTDAAYLDKKLGEFSLDEFFIKWLQVNPTIEYFKNESNEGVLSNYAKAEKYIKDKSNLTSEGKMVYDTLARLDSKKRFTGVCGEIITPFTVGIKLTHVDGLPSSSQEVWFSGKCMMIDAETFAGIVLKEKIDKGESVHNTVLTRLSGQFQKARKANK